MLRAVPHHWLLQQSRDTGRHQHPAPGGFFQKLFPPSSAPRVDDFCGGCCRETKIAVIVFKAYLPLIFPCTT